MNKAMKFLDKPWHWLDFTDRQREVLNQFCLGTPMTTIAESLGLSRSAAYFHLNRAITKINKSEGLTITVETLTEAYINKLGELIEENE